MSTHTINDPGSPLLFCLCQRSGLETRLARSLGGGSSDRIGALSSISHRLPHMQELGGRQL